MNEEQDAQFLKTFSGVLGALVIFMIAVILLARAIGTSNQKTEVASDEATARRIAPVGQVTVGDPSAMTAPTPGEAAQTPADASPQTGSDKGKEIYDSACFVCHTPGAVGAPKLGDKEAWAPRITQGMDTLVNHAINGFQGSAGVMPPKGGRMDLSDDDIKAAVTYMVVGASQ